jgi:hypothetical protein
MKEGEKHHLKGRIIEMEHSRIYVLVGKLRMKIMQKEHDLPMSGLHGEQTTRMAIKKRFY